MNSVLQDWVMGLALREQGTLLTCVRGCDEVPKLPLDSPARHLTAYLRWCFMNPADPREVDFEPGVFFLSTPPDFKASELGHLPLHWYSHVMHAAEVIAYRHPDAAVAFSAGHIYFKLARGLHLAVEPIEEFTARMSEDRIARGAVVS